MSEDAVVSELRPGDVAHDLVKRGKVMVVGQAAETVAEHQARTSDYDIQEYGANGLLNVSADEPVWKVVFLPDEPKTEFSGTYDYPDSRLARIPVEEAAQDVEHPNRSTIVELLAEVFRCMRLTESLSNEDVGAVADQLVGVPRVLVDEAMELSEVDDVIGGGDDAAE